MGHGSAFGQAGANILLPPYESLPLGEQLRRDHAVTSSSDPYSRSAHRAAATLWSYAESLYFVAHELGVEIHGPYALANGEYLLVRDFFRPAPTELWPGVASLLDFERLRIATTYSAFHGRFDVYNNHYLDGGFVLPAVTTAVAAWRDGTLLSVAELEDLSNAAGMVIADVVGRIEGWTTVEIARKYVEVFWWRKHELALAARGTWRAPAEVLAQVTEEAIPPGSAKNPSIDQLRRDFDLT
jgi:hypothetical protein